MLNLNPSQPEAAVLLQPALVEHDRQQRRRLELNLRGLDKLDPVVPAITVLALLASVSTGVVLL